MDRLFSEELALQGNHKRESIEEFDAAGERYIEDPGNNPLPLPCASEGCEGIKLDYDPINEVYSFPVCGWTV